MAEKSLCLLFDQNVPYACRAWMQEQRPEWDISHVKDLGFEGKDDKFLYQWSQAHNAIIVTYDEDFADARMYHLGTHRGIIRLRVWPTTVEQTKNSLLRLMESVPDKDWRQSLIIIDNQKIRIRKVLPGS
jgi:predicted nuclease of predicted toxin-antitoxin system